MIVQFVKKCSEHGAEEVRVFGKYFDEYYAHRPEEWALGLRGIFVNTTTMAVEAFHHLLKYHAQFMNGKFNHRLDSLFKHLNSYMAQMKYRDLKASAAQRVTDKTSALNFKDHNEASSQSLSLVNSIGDGWSVHSFTHPGVTYEVKRTGFNCTTNPCYKACWDCGVCYHQYTCTCPRVVNAHHRATCKHSHLVQM